MEFYDYLLEEGKEDQIKPPQMRLYYIQEHESASL